MPDRKKDTSIERESPTPPHGDPLRDEIASQESTAKHPNQDVETDRTTKRENEERA